MLNNKTQRWIEREIRKFRHWGHHGGANRKLDSKLGKICRRMRTMKRSDFLW